MPTPAPKYNITRYLRETCQISYQTPIDRYSAPPSTPIVATVPCRFDYRRHLTLDKDGKEVLAEGLVFLQPNTPIDLVDRILFAGRTWLILKIFRLHYLDRESHLEVSVQ